MSYFHENDERRVSQLDISKRWLDRANDSKDLFAKFVFHWIGFNALYFLYKSPDPHPRITENDAFRNFLSTFNQSESKKILDTCSDEVKYFQNRRPIQRMDRPSSTDGTSYKTILSSDSHNANDKLNALVGIVYLVRCNLAHGSKSDNGDDKEIIKKTLPVAKVLHEDSIKKVECLNNQGRWP